MTNNKQWKKWFEANYLDGDKIQSGQMLSSEECFNAIQQTLDTQRSELLSQIKGIGCEEGVDLVTVARIINKLNGVVYKAIIK